MGARSKRLPVVLVTGFGPFPGVPVNQTARLVSDLAAAPWPFAARLVSAVLPVAWAETVDQLTALYELHRPRIGLHFGVSHRARGFEIETIARNTHCGQVDDRGHVMTTPRLVDDGPMARRSRWPVADMLDALARSGLPARRSNDPGRYLCNATLYHALGQADGARRAHRPALAGFVHVPVEERGNLSRSDLVTGARTMIEVLLRTV